LPLPAENSETFVQRNMVRISSSVLVVYYIALKTAVQCPCGSISTSYRNVGFTYLELSYYCIDNQLVVLKDLLFLLNRKPLSRSGGGEEEEEEEEEKKKKKKKKKKTKKTKKTKKKKTEKKKKKKKKEI
jgi:hypothetical protein